MNSTKTSLWLVGLCLLPFGCSGSSVVGTKDGSGGGGQSSQGTGGKSTTSAGGGVVSAGGSTSGGATMTPSCTPQSASESACSNGVDDDCDGFPDCRDSECEGQPCATDGYICTAGACLKSGGTGLPALPPIDNVSVRVTVDTAIVDFEPLDAALDYRIYPLPAPGDVLTGADGSVVVKNAIYRCAGDRPRVLRDTMQYSGFDRSLAGKVAGYTRTQDESILGYVYLTPAADRKPVYRMADPNGGSGYLNADWNAPPFAQGNVADYVVGSAERDRLLLQGFRDDGVAFYVPDSATRSVYRMRFGTDGVGSKYTTIVFYTDGKEQAQRASVDPKAVEDSGERFRVLAAPASGAVALHRVFYGGYAGEEYDVLAAGEARFQDAWHQGNRPLPSLSWPGLTGPTTLVIEALDQGCPFPGGYLATAHREPDKNQDGSTFNLPSITLDEARLETTEVFVNGQHEPKNRPKPIARAFVDVMPTPKPKFDYFEGFDAGSSLGTFQDLRDNNARIFRNDNWAIDTSGCTDNFTFGPLLGQFTLGFTDGGSSCNISITPRKIAPQLKSNGYLHVRMSSDIPSTHRRYPQIMLTTIPVIEPSAAGTVYDVPIHTRLGSLPFNLVGPDMMAGTADDLPPSGGKSIIVQPFGTNHELQIEFCDQRGWGVSQQCPQANVYGHHANNYSETWSQAWTPVPVLGEVAGFDRLVQFDVYASTDRVYVFIDDKPAGCAALPAGKMPAGAVTVAFRSVIYHSGIDEGVVPADSPQQYLRRYSLSHSDRRMDDFGIELDASLPAWNEATLPCGARFYGGG